MSETSVADRRLHPGTVALRIAKNLPSTVLGIPAALAVATDIGIGRVLTAAGIASVLLAFFSWLSWRTFRFGIGAHEVVIETGLLSRNRRTIPVARIHDIDIERGPLERLFGLAKVRIETGGAAKDEGLLDSLGLADAEALRTAIRAGRAGESASRDVEARPPLFAMSVGRVLVSGLFNFSLVWIAALFGLLQSFDDWLPFDLYDWGRWIGLAERQAGRFTPGMIAAALLLAGLLGVLTGIARTLGRDFGYRLTAEPKGLRRERGLFTRTEAVIPKRRIQLAVVEAGLVRRTLGWRALSFQTVGAGGEESGRQSASPLATPDEVAAVLAEVEGLRQPDAAELVRVSRRHVTKALIALFGLLLPVILVAGFIRVEAFLLLLAFPLLALESILARRSHRYAIAGGLLFVQRGFVDRKLWIAPLAKVQSVSVMRSWLQRRLGLSTLVVDTAGAPALGGVRIIDLPAGDAGDLADSLARYRSG